MSAYTINKLTDMKADLEDQIAERNKLEGRLDQIKETLLKEFKCDSVKTAKRELEKMREDYQTKQAEYERRCAEYKEKYDA